MLNLAPRHLNCWSRTSQQKVFNASRNNYWRISVHTYLAHKTLCLDFLSFLVAMTIKMHLVSALQYNDKISQASLELEVDST